MIWIRSGIYLGLGILGVGMMMLGDYLEVPILEQSATFVHGTLGVLLGIDIVLSIYHAIKEKYS